MTQTTTSINPPPQFAARSDIPPAAILMNVIVALLAPMFLCGSAGDVDLARMGAIETVNAYRARNHADLIAVAQIIAFGLSALGSLSLSMADDISLAMTLRLRGNAVSLDRSAERNRRAIRENRDDDPMPHLPAMSPEAETPATNAEDDSPVDPDVFLNAAAAQMLALEAQARLREPEQTFNLPPASPPPAARTQGPTTAAEKRHQEMWAIAMVKEAGEITASIPNLPPAERSTAMIRAAVLGSTANELLTGVSSRPPEARSRHPE